MTEAKLVDVQELSKLTSLPVSWIYRRVREASPHPIPYVKAGHYVRFEPDKVMDWLRTRAGMHYRRAGGNGGS